MGVFEIIGSILLILSCIVLVIVISMQSSKTSGGLTALGAARDSGSSVASRNKAKTMDAMMLKITKIVTIVMFALTFIVYAIGAFVK